MLKAYLVFRKICFLENMMKQPQQAAASLF